ncbi:MAG: hypothetical protein PHD53_00170 [Methylococcales bacterium]|nr:hypothetical protein [Methylococcales bacterium]
MAQTFNSTVAVDIGIADKILFTATSKTMLIGCNFSNKTVYELPITVWIVRSTTIINLVNGYRIGGNQNDDIIKGKVVLLNGDILKANCPLDASFDALISTLEGLD